MSPSTTVSGRKLAYKPRVGRERRRKLIEEAAIARFAERGYDATSIDEIAAAAGVTKPTLYDHFPSKRELYVHLLAGQAHDMVESLTRVVQETRLTPAEQVREAVNAFFSWVEEHPFAWRMLFREPPQEPELEEGARWVHERSTGMVATTLRRLEPQLPEQELQLRAEALKSAQQGLATWWYDHPDVPRGALVDAVVGITPIPP